VSTAPASQEGPVIKPPNEAPTQALIPGAYERNTLTYRQAGSMTAPAYNSSDQPNASLLDAATVAAREMEGGGGVSQRPRRKTTRQDGRAPARDTRNDERPTRGYLWLRFWRYL
jgi:hypothetical protein